MVGWENGRKETKRKEILGITFLSVCFQRKEKKKKIKRTKWLNYVLFGCWENGGVEKKEKEKKRKFRNQPYNGILVGLNSNSKAPISLQFWNVNVGYLCYATVVPVLFQNSLKQYEEDTVANLDHIFGVEPMKISSPSTDAEVALALRVLEGCCLLHRESTIFAHQHKAIEVCISTSFVHYYFPIFFNG